MKTRIIGTLLILMILGGLYVADGQESTQPQPTNSAPSFDDSAMKSLSL